jgi:hypothetical protein
MSRLQAVSEDGAVVAEFYDFEDTGSGLRLLDHVEQTVGFLPFDAFHKVVQSDN